MLRSSPDNLRLCKMPYLFNTVRTANQFETNKEEPTMLWILVIIWLFLNLLVKIIKKRRHRNILIAYKKRRRREFYALYRVE